MFATTLERQFGARSWLRVTVALGPEVTAALIEREGLVFASCFARSLSTNTDRAFLYVLLSGRLQVEGVVHEAPVAMWLHEDQAEGGPHGVVDWVNVGEPLRAVELRFPLSRVRAPLGSLWAPSTRVCAAAYAAWGDPDFVPALVDVLVEEGTVAPVASAGAARSVHDRLWEAVRPLARGFDLLGSLDEVASHAGVSTRSIARDLAAFTQAHVVPFESWRSGTRQMRLKLAVLALSAPDLSITEVAKLVGYGSVDAMSRAFRDATQPPPREVRSTLLALGEALGR